MTAEIKLKDKIRDYIPKWISDKHPLFLEFFEAYYEWLELQGNPVDIIRNFSDYLDLDKSIDSFVDHFKADIIPELPEYTAASKRIYLKHIDDLFNAKGTVASFKLLFRLLYNESIEVIYPRDNILVLSGTGWVDEIASIKTTSDNDVGVFKNQVIEARNYITDDTYTVTGTARVQDVIRYTKGLYIVTEMFLFDVKGDFNANDSIHFEDYSEIIIPSIVGVKVNSGGTLYRANRELDFDKTTQFIKTFTFTDSNDFDMGVSSAYKNTDIEVYLNGGLVADENIIFDGRVVTVFLSLTSGDTIEVRMPNVGLYGYLKNVDLITGALREISIVDFGVAYSSAPAIDLSVEGDGTATANFELGGLIKYSGKYTSDRSILSNKTFLFDGKYYQEYSYVIKSSKSIDKYKDIFKSLVHPSGFNLFNIIQLVARKQDDEIGVDFHQFFYDITTIAYGMFQPESDQVYAETVQMDIEKLSLDNSFPISLFFDMTMQDVFDYKYIYLRPPAEIVIS